MFLILNKIIEFCRFFLWSSRCSFGWSYALIAEMKASYSDLLGNKAFGSIVILNALSVTRTLAMAITHDTPKTTGNEMCAVRWGYHRT